MFKTKVTGYVVVMLILFQSFTAVASTLDFHTLDVEHLAEVHEHDKHDAHASPQAETNATSLDIAASSESPHNPSDCHHCGHCHGSHTQWVGDSVGIKQPPLDEGHAFFYLSKVIEAPITRLLRPPKFTS
jgi:cytochrome c553